MKKYLFSGDPRRPYPLDIEMRCGALGEMSQKIPPSNGERNFISNPIDMSDDFKSKRLLERQGGYKPLFIY